MTVIRFLPLRLTLRDAALVGSGGDPVAPMTELVIPGSTVRGLLNSACGADDALRARLIDSEQVQAAPAFPLVTADGTPHVAYPAPLVLATSGEDRIVDARRAHVGEPVEAVRGLVVEDYMWWYTASVATTTEQRLQRNRSRPGAEGFGPFTQTALNAGQQFVTRLRIVAADEQAAASLAEEVERVLRAHDLTAPDRRRLTVGAAGDTGFGGEVEVDVWRDGFDEDLLSTDPVPEPVRATSAGDRVDLVLRSPALVRDPATGRADPAALSTAVQRVLDEVLGAGKATADPASVARHALGGFHGCYRGPRPDHWAAAAGSTVRVRLGVDVTADEWREVLARRVGERPADGLGVLGLFAPRAGSTLHDEPAAFEPEPPDYGMVLLADGAPAETCRVDEALAQLTGQPATDAEQWQLAWLQDRMLWDAARDEIEQRAQLVARTAVNLPTRVLLGKLRELAASTGTPGAGLWPSPPAALAALFGERTTGADRSPPAVLDGVRGWLDTLAAADERRGGAAERAAHAALKGCKLPRADQPDLLAWLRARTGPDATVPDEIIAELSHGCLWPDDAPEVVAAWCDRTGPALRLLLVQRLVAALGARAHVKEEEAR